MARRQPDTGTVQRPSLALLGAEPFRAVMELARQTLGKPDGSVPGAEPSKSSAAASWSGIMS